MVGTPTHHLKIRGSREEEIRVQSHVKKLESLLSRELGKHMESRRKGVGVGHSVETGFDGVVGDKDEARVTVVCLSTESNEFDE